MKTSLRKFLLRFLLFSTSLALAIAFGVGPNHLRADDFHGQTSFQSRAVDDGGGSALTKIQDSKAYPEQTPHSGRHFLPSHESFRRPFIRRLFWKRRRRFMEGWYYRLTLTQHNISFAFIVSIEDPGLTPQSDLRLACMQVIGPQDGYLIQSDREDSKFWAYRKSQAFGHTFEFESKETAPPNNPTGRGFPVVAAAGSSRLKLPS